MNFLKIIFVIMLVVSGANAASYYFWRTKLLPNGSRSKTICDIRELHETRALDYVNIGWQMQSSRVCGLHSCFFFNKFHPAASDFLYCQHPALFAECETYGVDTTVDWPECCWKCVDFKKC